MNSSSLIRLHKTKWERLKTSSNLGPVEDAIILEAFTERDVLEELPQIGVVRGLEEVECARVPEVRGDLN